MNVLSTKILLFACILFINPATCLYPFDTNTEQKKSEQEHVVSFQVNKYGDYYIDRLSGKLLGRDRSKTNNLRVIDKREWNFVLEEKGGPQSREGIRELHRNSFVIVFDENQIQKEIQLLGADTAQQGIEHQLYIVLNVNNGQVFAKRELSPNRIFKTRSIIETYTIGKTGAPRVAEGLMLLSEVHGHPRTINFYEINIEAASEIDKKVARELNINIFVVDAFDTKIDDFPRAIHKVNNLGHLETWVGQTIGGKNSNTFNFTNYFSNMLKENDVFNENS